MKSWSITQARANMSDVFEAALVRGPQRIERRDSDAVVMVSEADWNRLVGAYSSMAELILNAPVDPGDLPTRRPARIITKDMS